MNKDFIRDAKLFIKDETDSAVRRLQSIKLPADLRLGGTKFIKRGGTVGGPNGLKKQFVPNINVARNKEKSNDFVQACERKDNRGKKQPKFQNKKSKDNTPRVIQSSGIFSDGIANDIRRANRWTDTRDKENDNVFMPVPTIKKNVWNINKQEEDKILDEIMGDDEDDDDSSDEKGPFQPYTCHFAGGAGSSKYDLNLVKSEPLDNAILFNEGSDYIHGSSYSDNNPSLALWELPDSLAGKGLSDDPNCKELFDYNLSDMLEGQIGKLVRRKSGKLEIHIGNVKYDLHTVTTENYTEELVNIDISDKKNAKATVLGQIQNRYKITPKWDLLMK